MIAIPKEPNNMLTFPKGKPMPILKENASNKQKIIYGDFITELLDKTCFPYEDDFFKTHKG